MKGNKDFTGISIPPSHGCGEFWKRDLLRLVSRQAGIVLRVGSGLDTLEGSSLPPWLLQHSLSGLSRGAAVGAELLLPCILLGTHHPQMQSSPGLVKPGSPLSSTGNCALCSPFYPTGITITDCIFSCHKNTFCTLIIAW